VIINQVTEKYLFMMSLFFIFLNSYSTLSYLNGSDRPNGDGGDRLLWG
jgi:hypothetical protein